MKKSVLLFLVVAMVLSIGGCAKKAATPKIGVCIYKFDDTFMSYVRNQIETAAKDKIELSVQDSQYDQPKQNDQVDQFLTQGVTALAINLVDPSAVSVIIGKAKAKNVPLVLTAPIPGCETLNAAYFERHGLALRAFEPRLAATEARRLLEDEQARETMLRCQREQVPARAAESIASFMVCHSQEGSDNGS